MSFWEDLLYNTPGIKRSGGPVGLLRDESVPRTKASRPKTKTKAELVAEVEELTQRIAALEEFQAQQVPPPIDDEALACRDRAIELFLTVPDDSVYGEILKDLLQATDSSSGVFGYIDEHGAYVVPLMTANAAGQPQDAPGAAVFPPESWEEGSGPQAIRERRTVVENGRAPGGPQGQAAVPRHVSLPLVHHGRTIGLIQVADRDSDYRPQDVALLETVGKGIAPLLGARLRQDPPERQRVAEKDDFREAHEALKTWATKRFEELAKANEDLVAQLAHRNRTDTQALRRNTALAAVSRILQAALTTEDEQEVARTCIEAAAELTGAEPSVQVEQPREHRWRGALKGLQGAFNRGAGRQRRLTLPRFRLPGFRSNRSTPRALRVLLVVDNSPAFLRTLESSLSRHAEFDIVGCAENYSTGVGFARTLKPDLAVVDMTSTGTSGLEAIFQLRGQSQNMGIVAVSLWHSRSSKHAARESGADDFVLRSDIESGLVEALRRLGSPLLRASSE
jgi:CheY-like chemotaxis protein